MKKNLALYILIPVILIFNSCLGLSMDIQMNRDGSGRVIMEYRISQVLQNLGAFDGNEMMSTIPVSMEDWKKTIERIPGLKLVSHSVKTEKQDSVINVTLDFEDEDVLIKLLDPIGENVSIKRQGNSGIMELILLDEDLSDESMMSLTQMLMDGYNFSISFRAAGNSALTITNGTGESISAPASSETVTSGKKVSFSIGMADIFDLKDGLGLKFTW